MISASAALTGSYDYIEVARSVFIAIVASYAALDLAGRVTAAKSGIRLAWLSGGAIAMGIGIWAMHFKGMLAFHLPVPVEYYWPTVLASLLVVILASAVALYVASRPKMGPVEALTGSIFMGAGIAGMHYIGMAAMRLPAVTQYSPFLVTCSILLAILFSLIALLMAFGLREETRWSVPRRLGSATVMGVAVSAMHYTGMAAAGFIPASPPDLFHAVSIPPLGNYGVSIATLIVLVAAVITSSVDRWARDISEKKRAEDELRRQKEVFQKIFEHIPVTISFIGQDGQVELVNPEWERTIGWTLEEIRRQNLDLFAEFYPDPQHRQRILDLIAASTGEWTDRKVRVKDGRVIDLAMAVVHLSDGTSVAIGRDITERKRAEQSLLLFRMLIDQSNDAIEVIDPETLRFIDVNGRACLDLGYSREELLSLSVYDVDPFVDELMLARVAGKIENSGSAVFESFHRRKDGSTFPVEVSIKQVRLDRVYEVSVVRDITERKRAEAELRESEARFRLVADSAPVMIWMSGTDKLCTYFNKPWLDFTGRSIDRELGNGWADGVAPEDLQRCLDTFTQAFDRREAFKMEYRLRRNDGEYRWVLDIGVARFNPDRSFAGYIGSCIDMTDQRRAEGHLRRAQEDLARVSRVVAMGELAAAIAHEVNQPLGAVVTNASASLRWLAGQPPNLGEAREAIDRTIRDANRASEVIVRIRALFQKVPPQMEQLDVNVVIREVLTLSGNELLRSGVAIQTNLAPDVPNVLGDRVQLQEVLLNLILNGIDAMRMITHRPRELRIKSAIHPDGVLIQVHDSGDGVNPEQANHIFEPFFTTKHQGIGIGLSVGRSIIEAHGGRLWFTPGPSHGVVFQFTVPKADTSDERAA